jgi:hypothetical protein
VITQEPAPATSTFRVSPTACAPSPLLIALEAAAPREDRMPPPLVVVVAAPVAVPVVVVVSAPPARVLGGSAVLACVAYFVRRRAISSELKNKRIVDQRTTYSSSIQACVVCQRLWLTLLSLDSDMIVRTAEVIRVGVKRPAWIGAGGLIANQGSAILGYVGTCHQIWPR